jgi:hypothetical protein
VYGFYGGFLHKPWLTGIPYDHIEDALHSFTATAMGFAFTAALVFRLLQRQLLDGIAIAAATVVPLLMLFYPTIAGLVQRLMFLVAYTWYGTETLSMF